MQASDFNAFRQVMAGLAELHGKTLSGPLLDLYWNALGSWSLDDFRTAAALLVQTKGFMPKPSDFAALATADGSAGVWLQVLDNVKSSRYRRGETVGGAVDKAVAAIGGYSAIGMCDTDKLHWMEKRFREIYGEIQDAAPAISFQGSKRIGCGETPTPLRQLLDAGRFRPEKAGNGDAVE